ncbi:MAG: flagellar hook capping FlgD N-terminal domain-containing protein [Syntrophorhabdales bacterium]|jgi:flagellar basal-body rod modification protein FlgD
MATSGVTTAPSTGSTAPSTGSTASSTGSSTSLISNTDFLQILIAQLQNQDPLNPTDPDQFVTELAEMTQVESLQNIQSSITSLTNTLGNGSLSQWVSAVGDHMQVNDTSISEGDEVVLSPSGNWDSITLNLQNKSDGTSKQVSFSSGDSLVYSDTTGNYTVEGATATLNGQPVTCGTQVLRYISGVQTSSSGVELVASDGTTYAPSAITQITN